MILEDQKDESLKFSLQLIGFVEISYFPEMESFRYHCFDSEFLTGSTFTD